MDLATIFFLVTFLALIFIGLPFMIELLNVVVDLYLILAKKKRKGSR